MASLRKLFHDLANKQNLITLGTEATEEEIKDLLKKDLPQDIKESLTKILSNMEKVHNGILQLNDLVSEIKERIYQTNNPDEEF